MSVPLYVLQEQSERMDIVYAMRREAFTPEQDNRAKRCIAEVKKKVHTCGECCVCHEPIMVNEKYVEATYENKRCHLGCMETEPIESVLSFFGVPMCVTNSDGKEVHIYG